MLEVGLLELIFKFRLVHPILYVYFSVFRNCEEASASIRISFKNYARRELSAALSNFEPALLSFVPLMIFLCISFSCVWESNLKRWSGEYQLMLSKAAFLPELEI